MTSASTPLAPTRPPGRAQAPAGIAETAAASRAAEERRGIVYALFCAAAAAFVPAVAKLTTADAHPLDVAAVTSVLGALAAAAALWYRGEIGVLVDRRRGPLLGVVGALGTAAPFFLLYTGVRRASAIEAILCLQIEPVYALAGAWLFLGHRPTARRMASAAVLLLGIGLAVGAGPGMPASPGMPFLLATPLCWQASHLVVLRYLPGLSALSLTGGRYVYGGLVLALAATVLGGSGWTVAATGRMGPLLALQGIVLGYVGTVAWYGAITRLDLARATAIVVPSVPLLALLASFTILGEVPTARNVAGLLLAAVGVGSFVTARDARGPA